jgi:hypothetical protein
MSRSPNSVRMIKGREFLLAGRTLWLNEEHARANAEALRKEWALVRRVKSAEWILLYVHGARS